MKQYLVKVDNKYLASVHLGTGKMYFIHGRHNGVPLNAEQAKKVCDMIPEDRTLVNL